MIDIWEYILDGRVGARSCPSARAEHPDEHQRPHRQTLQPNLDLGPQAISAPPCGPAVLGIATSPDGSPRRLPGMPCISSSSRCSDPSKRQRALQPPQMSGPAGKPQSKLNDTTTAPCPVQQSPHFLRPCRNANEVAYALPRETFNLLVLCNLDPYCREHPLRPYELLHINTCVRLGPLHCLFRSLRAMGSDFARILHSLPSPHPHPPSNHHSTPPSLSALDAPSDRSRSTAASLDLLSNSLSREEAAGSEQARLHPHLTNPPTSTSYSTSSVPAPVQTTSWTAVNHPPRAIR